jgi:hypothetical protein
MTSHSFKPSAWQARFARETRQLSSNPEFPLRLNEQHSIDSLGRMVMAITLDTSSLAAEDDGLHFGVEERFRVYVKAGPTSPPAVTVEHDRFVGFPHVMFGHELCIYLDPSREWNPLEGATGFFNRVWDWLADAAEAKFSAKDALFHAVGGVPTGSEPDETIVVRQSIPEKSVLWWGERRTEYRVDLSDDQKDGSFPVAVWLADKSMPFGTGDTLGQLLARLTSEDGRHPQAFLRTLTAVASRLPDEATNLYFLVAVAHPSGGQPHLTAGRLDSIAVAALKRTSRAVLDARIGWCAVSDERETVSTRRDVQSGAANFLASRVVLIGCGALGSWMAEFIARAGATSIFLSDPATISGGLLVRQNYLECDVGREKAEALAHRLRQISDRLQVSVATTADDAAFFGAFSSADFVIDATANVAAGMQLQDLLQNIPNTDAVVAQVATDPATGTMGMVLIRGVQQPQLLRDIDSDVGTQVKARTDLEPYHAFWDSNSPMNQIIPVRGCSIPTFHGAAADLAAIAAIATSTLGRHRFSALSGAHLFALPSGYPSAMPTVWLHTSAAGPS